MEATNQGNGISKEARSRSNDVKPYVIEGVEIADQRWPQVEISSRAQLIKCIKRGESPTWVPNPVLEALVTGCSPMDHDDQRQSPSGEIEPSEVISQDMRTCQKQGMTSPSLASDPAEIERPRSALHTGDFFEKHSERSASPIGDSLPPSPTTPWYAPAVPAFSPHPLETVSHPWSRPTNTRSRAPSLGSSLSSSFVFRAPTSPLVHAASNNDLDSPATIHVAHQSSSPERGSRRRTLPPDSFYSFRTASATNYSRPFFPLRREPSLPYQAHQPRRSLTLTTMDNLASNPQTPMVPRSRRPSISSDHSPIQHASMVGSFEESILRGRMSTAPSKPLDFVAQIGVLGRGDCKSNLRCPAHVTVPFPAVFYNYPSVGDRSFSDDRPSPYVGTIDLEHSLKPIEIKRNRRHPASPAPSVDDLMKDVTAPENTHIGLAIDRKKRDRHRRRSASPKGPLGGCYRVPQQGQLQIVIKNPNKTAVKLYLVPYSLDGMEAGTKTFVRQRSFSAGPILEKPLTDNPQAIVSDPFQYKSILRYLIHLKFCCPSKGRYYLYDNIRVVFANRVPDGKESLRNEFQLPEPQYSSYRPGREALMGSAGAKLTAEKASRRRSSGFGLPSAGFDAMGGLSFTGPVTTLRVDGSAPAGPAATPFHLLPRFKDSSPTGLSGLDEAGPRAGAAGSAVRPGHQGTIVIASGAPELQLLHERTRSPTPGFAPSTSARASPVLSTAIDLRPKDFASHLLTGTVSPTPAECGEGLLTRELKSKDTHKLMDTQP